MHFDLPQLIQSVGYLGLFVIVFAECGLLVGVLFPGDSLLFTAGILSASGHLNIAVTALVCFVAAITGNAAGYWLGHRYGRKLFDRPDSLIFRRAYVEKAQAFYNRHGGKTIILARFVPIVRTLAPVIAGIVEMPFQSFLLMSLLGGLGWSVGVSLLGFFLGRMIPNIDHYLLPIIAVIIAVSILPSVIEILKDPDSRQAIRQQLPGPFRAR